MNRGNVTHNFNVDKLPERKIDSLFSYQHLCQSNSKLHELGTLRLLIQPPKVRWNIMK